MFIIVKLVSHDYEKDLSISNIQKYFPKSMLNTILTTDPSVTDINIEVASITPPILDYIAQVINEKKLSPPNKDIREGLIKAGKYFILDMILVACDPLYSELPAINLFGICLINETNHTIALEDYEKGLSWAIQYKYLQLIDYLFRHIQRPYSDIDSRMFNYAVVYGLIKVVSAFITVRKIDLNHD